MIEGMVILLLVVALFYEWVDDRNGRDPGQDWDPPERKFQKPMRRRL